MSLSVGIVGLPNVGKSTLFNALLKKQLAKVAPYPFTTIEPYNGVIDVPDERLTSLTLMVKPEKATPATITFIDIAGLVKGAHGGEGLGNEFLGHIRGVDAILHVVRAFENSQAMHPLGTVDPERDIEIVNTELILKDLDTVSKMAEKEKDPAKKGLLTKIKDVLNKGLPASKLDLDPEEEQQVRELQLLTTKPVFYVLNISEKEIGSPKIAQLEEKDFLVVCAKLETDLLELSPLEQQEYLKSLRVSATSLEKVIREAYEILDLITFYTIKGGKEVRAWPVKKGTAAIEAAATVHTDMAYGFIKTEVIAYKDLVTYGSWHKAHQEGKIRFEGRDYLISDGDIVEFKFKV